MRFGVRVGPAYVSGSTKVGSAAWWLLALALGLVVALFVTYWPAALIVGGVVLAVGIDRWRRRRRA
jgi:hypothetical protein